MEGFSELQKIRREHEIMFNFREKYSKLIEINREKRSLERIINFVKRYILLNPVNISESEIRMIPSLFRFRCYVYDVSEEAKKIDDDYSEQLKHISDENDIITQEILRESLEIDRQVKIFDIYKSKNIIKYPILLDLTLYGYDQSILVNVNGILYNLDEQTKQRIRTEFSKIDTSSIKGQKFEQLIRHSRAVVGAFILSKNKHK